FAAVGEFRAKRGTAPGQVVEVHAPTRAQRRSDADQVPNVQGGLKLAAEDAIVAEVEILDRSQRVVRIALDEREIEDRNVFDFQQNAVAAHEILRLVQRLSGEPVGDRAAEDRPFNDLLLFQSGPGENNRQARIAGRATGKYP